MCDIELKPLHSGVNKEYISNLLNKYSLFSLCVHELMLKSLCENGTKRVSKCWGLLLEDFSAIARSFDKSQNLMIL